VDRDRVRVHHRDRDPVPAGPRAGFGIADIRDLLAAGAGRPSATRQWRELATRKLPEISALISALTELRAVIAACLDCGCMDFENCQLLTRPADASR
jgi:MerR family redox-sensitive transcriptional activator SoxR